ncbi:2,3-bisphosphoglycerate-independent phosphoglycerate mutase [Candidatus Dependentiae bacterium]|nr:2,3-bisphosphoglycerate-independent phosphoglycerate mutase [Candidatus Dependentiae bacterium]
MKQGPHVLVILDGFGYRHAHEHNAISHAKPHNLLRWTTYYPHTTIHASGSFVGLPPGMIGNSEVGHLTLGSGRIIKQPMLRLQEDIESGIFFKNDILIQRFQEIKKNHKRVHIMGLLSDAGVHSSISHLVALITMAHQQGVESIVVHPFLDGRDTPPESAVQYLRTLEEALTVIKSGIIGTIHGRFYAMDRDNHWERTERSYKILTTPQKPSFTHWQEALLHSYEQAITDEFFIPLALDEDAFFKEGDLIIFFNFRADRARQLTQALVEPSTVPFPAHELHYSSMITGTSYHPDLNVEVLLKTETVHNTFFDLLERAQKRIFTIAETEKYAHVTYFFNGGRELIRTNETRVLVPSKRHYATYAFTPEMSALEITQTVIQALEKNNHDFYLINYANADMVGHSGEFTATCKAITILDTQLERLYQEVIEKQNGTLYITADHGKAEDMWDTETNQPRTAHTTHKVPFIVIEKNKPHTEKTLETPPLPRELATVAAFILTQLSLEPSPEMKKDVPSIKKEHP